MMPGADTATSRQSQNAEHGPVSHKLSPLPVISRIFGNAWDFIYPPLCTICDNSLSDSDRWLCPSCLDKLKINSLSRNACPKCGQNRSRRICACEIAWDYPFDRVFSIFDFDDTIQAIAHQIKYQGKKNLAIHLGQKYFHTIPADFITDADFFIPVPLHAFRRLKRGYNQAEYFALGISRTASRPTSVLTGIIKRTKDTKTQTKLDKEQRMINLKDAFMVPAHMQETIRGKKIILVDDVVTTGATTGQCASVLLNAGAERVRVLSLARD